MKPPVIVVEHGDVNIFKSVQDAERYLEPIDVENSEFQAYDKEGNLLEIHVIEKERSSLFGKIKTKCVKVVDPGEKINRSEELKKTLIDFFKETGIYEFRDENEQLDRLISKAVKIFGYTS